MKTISKFIILAIVIIAGVLAGCHKDETIETSATELSLEDAIKKAFAQEIVGFEISPDGTIIPIIILSKVPRLKSAIENPDGNPVGQGLYYSWHDVPKNQEYISLGEYNAYTGYDKLNKDLEVLQENNPGKNIKLYLFGSKDNPTFRDAWYVLY